MLKNVRIEIVVRLIVAVPEGTTPKEEREVLQTEVEKAVVNGEVHSWTVVD